MPFRVQGCSERHFEDADLRSSTRRSRARIGAMPAGQDELKRGLVADLRTLSLEAKRPDSIAGQLTGWISGPEHPHIKDAAEAVIRKLSEGSEDPPLRDSEV